MNEERAEVRGIMPARPPIGRDKGGIQALDRAFLILDIIADAGGEAGQPALTQRFHMLPDRAPGPSTRKLRKPRCSMN